MTHDDHIRLNFILSLDSVPRPLELWKNETVNSVKMQSGSHSHDHLVLRISTLIMQVRVQVRVLAM